MAHIPLIEIRREYNIPPLNKPMYDDKELWPRSLSPQTAHEL